MSNASIQTEITKAAEAIAAELAKQIADKPVAEEVSDDEAKALEGEWLARVDISKSLCKVNDEQFKRTDAALALLDSALAGKVYDITTPAGMREAVKDRALVRGLRTSLEKKRAELKRPLLDQGAVIDAEAKRIKEALEKFEDPVSKLITDEQDRREAERLAKLQAEADRKRRNMDAIARLQSAPSMIRPEATSLEIQEAIVALKCAAPAVDSDFAETWQEAHSQALEAFGRVLEIKLKQEQEAKRLRSEAAALEAEKAELARQKAAIEAERAKNEAELAAAKAKADAERAEADRIAREARERQEAAERAERQRVDGIRRRISDIELMQRQAIGRSSDAIGVLLAELEEARAEDFAEFVSEAHAAAKATRDELKRLHAEAVKREQQEAEFRAQAHADAQRKADEAAKKRDAEAKAAREAAELERAETQRKIAECTLFDAATVALAELSAVTPESLGVQMLRSAIERSPAP